MEITVGTRTTWGHEAEMTTKIKVKIMQLLLLLKITVTVIFVFYGEYLLGIFTTDANGYL